MTRVEIPESLVERFSQSLFVSDRSPQAHHPVDDLLKYAKRFKRFRVGRDGIEATTQSSNPKETSNAED